MAESNLPPGLGGISFADEQARVNAEDAARRKALAQDTQRILILHPKAITDEDLHALDACVKKLLDGAPRLESITLARDEYNRNFERYNGWGEWCEHVATGKDYGTGKPCYTGYIVWPQKPVGRATAQILSSAMLSSKLVGVLFGFPETPLCKPELQRARTLTCVDSKDWKGGWRIDLE